MEYRDITPPDLTPLTESWGEGRSVGLHVSTLIRRIMKKLEPKRFSGKMDVLLMELGFAFERVLEPVLRKVWAPTVIRPGEFEEDGISLSPDGLDPLTATIHEFKLTFMGERLPTDPKFWHWITQIKAYCYATGCRTAILWAFFVGNLPFKSPLKCYELTFSAQELHEAWMMILNAKEEGE